MKSGAILREQADKLWNESISRIRRDSPFAKRGLAKVQAMYDKANELDKAETLA